MGRSIPLCNHRCEHHLVVTRELAVEAVLTFPDYVTYGVLASWTNDCNVGPVDATDHPREFGHFVPVLHLGRKPEEMVLPCTDCLRNPTHNTTTRSLGNATRIPELYLKQTKCIKPQQVALKEV